MKDRWAHLESELIDFDSDGHTFTRMGLVIFLLMIARGADTILNMA